MKLKILTILSLISLYSCKGEEVNQAIKEEKLIVNLFDDMSVFNNDLIIINRAATKLNEGNVVNYVNDLSPYGYKLTINNEKLNGRSIDPSFQFVINKAALNSDISIVSHIIDNDSTTYWSAVKIDTNYVKDSNTWVNVYIDNLNLPKTISKTGTTSFYFWSIDGKEALIDNINFKLNK